MQSFTKLTTQASVCVFESGDTFTDLDEELQLVVKQEQNNKMVLNLTKTKGIVFESNFQFKCKAQLNLSVMSVPIKQVEEIMLL